MIINDDNVLKESEYRKLCALIYEKSGINLGSKKMELVRARLNKRLKHHGLKSFGDYYDLLVNDSSGLEIVEMIDAISTNVTSFFREKAHFDFMEKRALPEIIEKKKKAHNRRLRVWCSACSTGEEPYTILITMMNYLGGAKDWDFRILATDISTNVLEKAQEGRYSHEKVKTVAPGSLSQFFDRDDVGKDKYYKIKEEYKRFIVFRRLNLMSRSFPFSGKFDCIFCRNVMIYFDRPTQMDLVKRLVSCLEVGGFLFIGHSESLTGFSMDNIRSLAPATFQKIKEK